MAGLLCQGRLFQGVSKQVRRPRNPNANKLELVYRAAYSHPTVQGIMAWIFWAGASWRGPNAAWARRDWTLTEAGQRFEALMAEWSTNTSGRTDSTGVLALRAFPGDYAATLTAPGQPPSPETFTLPPGKGTQAVLLKVTKSNGTNAVYPAHVLAAVLVRKWRLAKDLL